MARGGQGAGEIRQRAVDSIGQPHVPGTDERSSAEPAEDAVPEDIDLIGGNRKQPISRCRNVGACRFTVSGRIVVWIPQRHVGCRDGGPRTGSRRQLRRTDGNTAAGTQRQRAIEGDDIRAFQRDVVKSAVGELTARDGRLPTQQIPIGIEWQRITARSFAGGDG